MRWAGLAAGVLVVLAVSVAAWWPAPATGHIDCNRFASTAPRVWAFVSEKLDYPPLISYNGTAQTSAGCGH